MDQATHIGWQQVQLEQLKGSICRKVISSSHTMIAQIFLKKNDEVPSHSHANEQITYILSGALEFWLGAHETQHVVVRAGEVLLIPPHLPHRAVALEDTLDVDIFNPPRQDWLNRTDDYLRR